MEKNVKLSFFHILRESGSKKCAQFLLKIQSDF